MESYFIEEDSNRNNNNSSILSEESVSVSRHGIRETDSRNISEGSLDTSVYNVHDECNNMSLDDPYGEDSKRDQFAYWHFMAHGTDTRHRTYPQVIDNDQSIVSSRTLGIVREKNMEYFEMFQALCCLYVSDMSMYQQDLSYRFAFQAITNEVDSTLDTTAPETAFAKMRKNYEIASMLHTIIEGLERDGDGISQAAFLTHSLLASILPEHVIEKDRIFGSLLNNTEGSSCNLDEANEAAHVRSLYPTIESDYCVEYEILEDQSDRILEVRVPELRQGLLGYSQSGLDFEEEARESKEKEEEDHLLDDRAVMDHLPDNNFASNWIGPQESIQNTDSDNDSINSGEDMPELIDVIPLVDMHFWDPYLPNGYRMCPFWDGDDSSYGQPVVLHPLPGQSPDLPILVLRPEDYMEPHHLENGFVAPPVPPWDMSDQELVRRVIAFNERCALIILEVVPDHVQSLRYIELRDWSRSRQLEDDRAQEVAINRLPSVVLSDCDPGTPLPSEEGRDLEPDSGAMMPDSTAITSGDEVTDGDLLQDDGIAMPHLVQHDSSSSDSSSDDTGSVDSSVYSDARVEALDINTVRYREEEKTRDLVSETETLIALQLERSRQSLDINSSMWLNADHREIEMLTAAKALGDRVITADGTATECVMPSVSRFQSQINSAAEKAEAAQSVKKYLSIEEVLLIADNYDWTGLMNSAANRSHNERMRSLENSPTISQKGGNVSLDDFQTFCLRVLESARRVEKGLSEEDYNFIVSEALQNLRCIALSSRASSSTVDSTDQTYMAKFIDLGYHVIVGTSPCTRTPQNSSITECLAEANSKMYYCDTSLSGTVSSLLKSETSKSIRVLLTDEIPDATCAVSELDPSQRVCRVIHWDSGASLNLTDLLSSLVGVTTLVRPVPVRGVGADACLTHMGTDVRWPGKFYHISAPKGTDSSRPPICISSVGEWNKKDQNGREGFVIFTNHAAFRARITPEREAIIRELEKVTNGTPGSGYAEKVNNVYQERCSVEQYQLAKNNFFASRAKEHASMMDPPLLRTPVYGSANTGGGGLFGPIGSSIGGRGGYVGGGDRGVAQQTTAVLTVNAASSPRTHQRDRNANAGGGGRVAYGSQQTTRVLSVNAASSPRTHQQGQNATASSQRINIGPSASTASSSGIPSSPVLLTVVDEAELEVVTAESTGTLVSTMSVSLGGTLQGATIPEGLDVQLSVPQSMVGISTTGEIVSSSVSTGLGYVATTVRATSVRSVPSSQRGMMEHEKPAKRVKSLQREADERTDLRIQKQFQERYARRERRHARSASEKAVHLGDNSFKGDYAYDPLKGYNWEDVMSEEENYSFLSSMASATSTRVASVKPTVTSLAEATADDQVLDAFGLSLRRDISSSLRRSKEAIEDMYYANQTRIGPNILLPNLSHYRTLRWEREGLFGDLCGGERNPPNRSEVLEVIRLSERVDPHLNDRTIDIWEKWNSMSLSRRVSAVLSSHTGLQVRAGSTIERLMVPSDILLRERSSLANEFPRSDEPLQGPIEFLRKRCLKIQGLSLTEQSFSEGVSGNMEDIIEIYDRHEMERGKITMVCATSESRAAEGTPAESFLLERGVYTQEPSFGFIAKVHRCLDDYLEEIVYIQSRGVPEWMTRIVENELAEIGIQISLTEQWGTRCLENIVLVHRYTLMLENTLAIIGRHGRRDAEERFHCLIPSSQGVLGTPTIHLNQHARKAVADLAERFRIARLDVSRELNVMRSSALNPGVHSEYPVSNLNLTESVCIHEAILVLYGPFGWTGIQGNMEPQYVRFNTYLIRQLSTTIPQEDGILVRFHQLINALIRFGMPGETAHPGIHTLLMVEKAVDVYTTGGDEYKMLIEQEAVDRSNQWILQQTRVATEARIRDTDAPLETNSVGNVMDATLHETLIDSTYTSELDGVIVTSNTNIAGIYTGPIGIKHMVARSMRPYLRVNDVRRYLRRLKHLAVMYATMFPDLQILVAAMKDPTFPERKVGWPPLQTYASILQRLVSEQVSNITHSMVLDKLTQSWKCEVEDEIIFFQSLITDYTDGAEEDLYPGPNYEYTVNSTAKRSGRAKPYGRLAGGGGNGRNFARPSPGFKAAIVRRSVLDPRPINESSGQSVSTSDTGHVALMLRFGTETLSCTSDSTATSMSGRRRERLLKEYSATMVGSSKSISQIELAEQIAAYYAFDNDSGISKEDFSSNVGFVLNNLLMRGAGPFTSAVQEVDAQAKAAESDFNEMIESSYADQSEARVFHELGLADRSDEDREHIEADDAQNEAEFDTELGLWEQTGPYGPQVGSSSIAVLNAFNLGNRNLNRCTVRGTGDLVGKRYLSRFYGIDKWLPRYMAPIMGSFQREQEKVHLSMIDEYKEYFDDRIICFIYLARVMVIRGKLLDLKVFALLIEKEVEYRDQLSNDELLDAGLALLTRRHMYRILATIRAQERPWMLFMRPMDFGGHPHNTTASIAASRLFGWTMKDKFTLTEAETHLSMVIHLTCSNFERCDHIISATDWNRPLFGVSLSGMPAPAQSAVREEIRTRWFKTHEESIPVQYWDFSVMHAEFWDYFPVEK